MEEEDLTGFVVLFFMHDGRILEFLELVGRRKLVVDVKVAGALARFRSGAGATLEDVAILADMVLFSSLSP